MKQKDQAVKPVYYKKGVPKKTWLTIEAVVVELAGIITNDDLWWSMSKNVERLSWRFTALHDLKPITYSVGTECNENALSVLRSKNGNNMFLPQIAIK